MNKSQARKILGLDCTEDEREVKKKYRKLMHENHPDNAGGSSDSDYAAKINTAYELIMKDFGKGSEKKKSSIKRKPKSNWKGKENPNAFCARPIFHEVEDFDGNNIGTIEIARGKYVWTYG